MYWPLWATQNVSHAIRHYYVRRRLTRFLFIYGRGRFLSKRLADLDFTSLMANRTKQRRSGGLTLLLYQRPLHPELFRILAAKEYSRKAYDADVWLVEGGHVVSFSAKEHTLAEVIAVRPEPVTDRGLIQTIPCRGERYHEMTAPGNIRYMISTQEEQLTSTLYEATKHEILTYAQRRELMLAQTPATPEMSAILSVMDVECRSHELLIQSFHLFDENFLVIKTQGIFEVSRK